MRRLSFGVSALLLLLPLALLRPMGMSAAAPVAPTDPTNLGMTLSGTAKSVTAGQWINQTKLDLHFQVNVSSGTITPQVEIQLTSVPFTGQPNFTGAAMSASGKATVPVTGLLDRHHYHWQARVTDSAGSSNWVQFGGLNASSRDFSVDTDPPSRPVIQSSTDPDQNQWYNTAIENLSWQSTDDLSGVAGYTYVVEHQSAHVIPVGRFAANHQVSLSNLGSGTWFLAVRAVDAAGNWSPTATYRLLLDRQPARIIWLSPARFSFNPYRGPTTLRFRLSKTASAQLALYRVGAKRPLAVYSYPQLRAGQVTTITWNGMARNGKPVAKGYYFFSTSLVDHAGNDTRVNVGGIYLTPMLGVKTPAGPVVYPDGGKRIIVSLSQQELYAYDGTSLAVKTLVTTGNPALPTPVGSYTILEKESPFQFVSPWPPGSPYWYAPSWVHYAMLFQSQGYFLHDAPWRSAYGPGTNGPGQPGTNYGGSHGCVNIPPDPMTFLWNWSPLGTPVDVVP